jgi:UDP-glucose 4-epimerase
MKRKILVTGGKGFIGSKVVARLKALGHDVTSYDLIDREDLMDLDKLEGVVAGVDVVFHIAAQADLTQMSGSPEEGRDGVRANVHATDNVAFLCAKHKKWLIFASTVCVYGNVKKHPAKEDETLPVPSDLYAASKYAAEWLIKGYGKNYDMKWTILRFATIYGPGMRPALGMHVFFKQAAEGGPITVHGDGKQERTLTFIDDLVEGIIAPLDHESDAVGEVFNLTSERPISAITMAEDVRRIMGSDARIVHGAQRPNQTIKEEFDVTKAERKLQWRAQTSWEDGLVRTREWFKGLSAKAVKKPTEKKRAENE